MGNCIPIGVRANMRNSIFQIHSNCLDAAVGFNSRHNVSISHPMLNYYLFTQGREAVACNSIKFQGKCLRFASKINVYMKISKSLDINQ